MPSHDHAVKLVTVRAVRTPTKLSLAVGFVGTWERVAGFGVAEPIAGGEWGHRGGCILGVGLKHVLDV